MEIADEKLNVKFDHKRRHSDMSDVNSDVSEIENRKKMKSGDNLTAAWAFFSDFARNSSFHGIKYLGERRRHWSERMFWVIAFLISVTGCSMMIYKIYIKWQLSPVIVSFAEKSTPVWQIPFPAVTICPETKAKRNHISFTKMYEMYLLNSMNSSYKIDVTNEDQLKAFEAVSQICDPHLTKDFTIKNLLDENDIVPLLNEMSVPKNDTITYCKWRNELHMNCSGSGLFSDIVTEEGMCQTFNILDASELFREENLADDFGNLHHGNKSSWSLQDGYDSTDTDVYPRRVLGAGTRGGFFVVLTANMSNYDFVCRGPVQGFKILLHTPAEIPRVSKQYFRVPMQQEVVISVKPNMMTTSAGLKDYSPFRRQCFFNHERYLKFFKSYTQNNCELECLSNYTRNACGCVKFSMPRDKDTRICGQKDIQCYDKAEDSLLGEDMKSGVTSNKDKNTRNVTDCNCLPSCTSINYDAEISQAKYDHASVIAAFGEEAPELDTSQMSRLTVYFKEQQFITSKRSELYGLTDFMANCGGLLGLFMGVSILSLIEIIYYLSLRFTCNLRYRKNKNVTLSESMGDLSQIQIPQITVAEAKTK